MTWSDVLYYPFAVVVVALVWCGVDKMTGSVPSPNDTVVIFIVAGVFTILRAVRGIRQ